MECHPIAFGSIATLRSPSAVNPSPAGEYSRLSVYVFHRSPEWVAMCNSILGCIWVDPRKSPNNGMNHLYKIFPPVRRFPDLHPIIACEPGRD